MGLLGLGELVALAVLVAQLAALVKEALVELAGLVAPQQRGAPMGQLAQPVPLAMMVRWAQLASRASMGPPVLPAPVALMALAFPVR